MDFRTLALYFKVEKKKYPDDFDSSLVEPMAYNLISAGIGKHFWCRHVPEKIFVMYTRLKGGILTQQPKKIFSIIASDICYCIFRKLDS